MPETQNIRNNNAHEQGIRFLSLLNLMTLFQVTKKRDLAFQLDPTRFFIDPFYIGSVHTALYPPHQRNEIQAVFLFMLYIRGILCILLPQCGKHRLFHRQKAGCSETGTACHGSGLIVKHIKESELRRVRSDQRSQVPAFRKRWCASSQPGQVCLKGCNRGASDQNGSDPSSRRCFPQQ